MSDDCQRIGTKKLTIPQIKDHLLFSATRRMEKSEIQINIIDFASMFFIQNWAINNVNGEELIVDNFDFTQNQACRN
jgi:hypothetical protein